MKAEHPDLARVRAMYDIAVSLRQSRDPLLTGQYEGIIGRLTALLAVLGDPVPDDALPQQEE